MSSRTLAVCLLLLLLCGVTLGASVLVTGPERVEEQSLELFESDQRMLAEQAAMRIWDSLNELDIRLSTASEHAWTRVEQPAGDEELTDWLSRLSHTADPARGITLAVVDDKGEVLAVAPGAEDDSVSAIESHGHRPRTIAPGQYLDICQQGLVEDGALLVGTPLDEEYTLAAHIEFEQLAGRIFEQVIRSRSTRAALLDPDGTVIHFGGAERGESGQEWVVGEAEVPQTGLSVEIAAPRSEIAPEINERVRDLLYRNYAVLGLFLVSMGLFLVLMRRTQRERLERVRALAHQDKLATLGMMAASTAHEIRNAITVANLQLQVAAAEVTDTKTSEHIDKASASVNRLADLAANLSRYAGKDQQRAESFALSDALDEAMGVVHPKMRGDVEVSIDADDNVEVFGSRAAIVQVVVNLLLNAFDALEDRRGGARVRVRTWRDDDEAVLWVTDNGDGIDPKVRDKIFEPFFSTKSSEESSGGTGIGLWLCSQIVEQHDGIITAGNVASGGARFEVRLPTADSAASVERAPIRLL